MRKNNKNEQSKNQEKKVINGIVEYLNHYLEGIVSVLFRLDKNDMQDMIHQLIELKKRKGRLFLLGVGGSAANCSHAVNDFRKICNIETYTPVDNVSELTARTNDDGWGTVFVNWLKGCNLSKKDAVMVFSVGGGSMEKNVSTNIVYALEYAKKVGAVKLGIVSRDGGYTKQVADVCILIPVIHDESITPYAESFQAVLWHAFANYPELAK